MTRRSDLMRAVRAHKGFWPMLDLIAHGLHLRGPVGAYLCDKADEAFGVYDPDPPTRR